MNLGTLVGYLGIDASDFDKGLDGALGKLDSFGSKGVIKAAAAGTAIAGAVGGAVLAGMDIEKANDKLTAQLGLTTDESERIGGIAGQLYAGAYGENLGEVNGAVAAVIGSIGGMRNATSADLQAVTANALDFATAMDVDVAGAATSAGILLKTGLADNAKDAFDLLTVAAQEAGPTMVEPIMEAANEYATNFASMGYSGEQAMALLVDASAGGEIAVDKIGDAVKEFSIRATDMSKTSVDAYDTLGLSADDMANKILAGGSSAQEATQQVISGLLGIEDPATRANTAIALFGTPIEDLNVTEIPAFLQSLQGAGGELENVAGATDRMGQALNDNASTNLESFKRQATQAFVDVLGGKVLPVVGDVASKLSTEFGPALSGAKDIITNDIGPALASLKGWIEDNKEPIEAVAGLITALFVPHLVTLGVTALATGAQTLAGWAITSAGAVGAAATHSIQIMIMIGRWVLLGATAVVQGLIIAAVWTAQIVASAVSGAVSFGVQVGRVVAGWVLMGAQATAQALRMAAAWFIALGPIGWVTAAVIGLVALIIANWDTVVSWTRKAWDWVTEKIGQAWDWIKDKVTSAGAAVRDAVVNAWNTVKDKTTGAWNSVKDAVSTGVSNVVSFVRELPGRILSGIGDLGSTLYDVGKDLLLGMVNGIKNVAGRVASAVKDAASAAVSGVKSFLGIHSPSRVFADIGANVGKGMVNGIASMRPAVAAEMLRMADTQALGSLTVPGYTAPSGGPRPPSSTTADPGTSSSLTAGTGPLFNVENLHLVEGTPRDVANELAVKLRTGG